MLTARPPRTALVVDDSAGARRRMTTLLRLGGWRVHEAVGMEAAVRQATVLDPDLVVTDMTMRRGNGPALLRALRQIGCTARFLAVSSHLTPDVRARAAAADATACLAKPVDPRLLVEVLAGLADEPTERSQGTAPRTMHVSAERLDLLEQARTAALRAPRPVLTAVAGRPALGAGAGQAMPPA